MKIIKGLLLGLLLFINNNIYANTTNDSSIKDKQQRIIELYIATFNRAPDRAGLDYWLNEMVNNNWSDEMVAQSMFMQPETLNLYKDKKLEDFITAVYKNVLNREPDKDGLAYWFNELISKRIPRERFIIAILNGAKDNKNAIDDVKVLNNKVEIAKYFTLEKGLNNVELARKVIQEVDSTPESVERIKKEIDEAIANNIDGNESEVIDNNLSVDEVASAFNNIKDASYKESLPNSTLSIKQDDTGEYLRAYLWLPKDYDSNKKYPAVVLAHGCGGAHYTDDPDEWTAQYIAGKFRVWGKLLSDNGFMVLLVDSFTTRDDNGDVGGGVCDTPNPLDRPSKIDPISVRPADIASGVAYLKSRDDVDSSRVDVLGFSNGGTASLVLSNHKDLVDRANELQQDGKEVFDLPYEPIYEPNKIITLYPGCRLNGYSQETNDIFKNRFKVDTDTYIFMASDDKTLPSDYKYYCNRLVDLNPNDELHLTTVANTDHQFDYNQSTQTSVKEAITDIVNLLRSH